MTHKSIFSFVSVVCACIVTQACATHPVTASTNTDAAAIRTAAATQSTPAPGVKRIELEDKTLTNDEVRQLFAQGYKPVGRNGEVYYCRSDIPLGSHVASVSCRTAQQIKELQEASKDMLATAQKTGGCSSAANAQSCGGH